MSIISNPALPRVIESNVSRLSFPSFILSFFHLHFIFRQKDSIFVKALDFLRSYSVFCFSFVPFVPVWVFNHMILWAAPSLSHVGDNLGPLVSSPSQIATSFYSFSPLNGSPVSSSSIFRLCAVKNRIGSVVCAASNANNRPLTGVLFEPFEEVKKELDLVPTVPQLSIARHKYSEECEAAVNEQINVEYNVSYAYHAMFAYFDRDNVALKGLAKLFKESSGEERNHAEKLMKYQNKRGGKVKLQSIVMPLSEFDHPEKGDALYAMELALSLEKLTNDRLLNLHAVADRNGDVQLCEFVESEFLTMQVESIKKISEYVAQLRRVGKGHGVWHFDQMLLHEEAAV